MNFSFANFFKDKDNSILSVEEDNEVDYLDKISNDVLGPKQNDSDVNDLATIKVVSDPIDDKVKSIKLISGLSDDKIDEFYKKMKVTPESARKMIESVLDMLSDDEKRDRNVDGLIDVLSKKLSSESLAKITAAFIILAEEDILEEVLNRR